MSDKHYVHQPDETELAKVLRESKGWFETYGTTLIYGISAVLALTALVVYLQRRPPATAPASSALLLASSIEDYQDLADQFPETEIGTRARLRQADLQTNSAIGKMFTDREVAVEELESARKAYERLVDRNDLSADMRERVLAGLARITESQSDGSETATQAAIAAWQKILDEFPDSKVFKQVAEERIASLKKPSSESFYAWFHKQDPKPGDDLLMPQDKPQIPDIPNAFELPEFGIPSGDADSPGAATTTEPSKPETTAEPSGEAAPSEEETPASDKQPEASAPVVEEASSSPGTESADKTEPNTVEQPTENAPAEPSGSEPSSASPTDEKKD